MSYEKEKTSLLENVKYFLQQDYRGVSIAIYSIAGLGLATAIHRVRPVSKFSKASQIPSHFIEKHEPLKGKIVSIAHSPVRLLIEHKAPIYLPFWHASKPPLPVQLWGVDIKSANAVSWLQCVAMGQNVTLKPIAQNNDTLVSVILLHLKSNSSKKVSVEIMDVGKKLVELGYATTSVPKQYIRRSVESQEAIVLTLAEKYAKNYRLGIWSDLLPPLPIYVTLWRKYSLVAAEKLGMLLKLTAGGIKSLTLRPFKKRAPAQ